MLEKGIIDNTMTEDEIRCFLGKTTNHTTGVVNEEPRPVEMVNAKSIPQTKSVSQKKKLLTPVRALRTEEQGRLNHPVQESGSEVTVYSRAVKMIQSNDSQENETSRKIDEFLTSVRDPQIAKENSRKTSSSSEELMDMDTSDETDIDIAERNDSQYFSDTRHVIGHGERKDQPHASRQEPDRCRDQPKLVRDAELNRANMFEVPGKDNKNITSVIDEDYQMIDAHIDNSLRAKILNFEFIDFSQLIAKNRATRDDEGQRLEIVNRNGLSYLSPISDRENVTISTYNRWEQVFRVYSNVLTSKYPTKSSELLQYNHTIHTASTSYSWDNVYSYGKEFRTHISRHPYRSWSVILQQAWTMLLKDRLSKSDNFFQRGVHENNRDNDSGRKEICKRFNWGKCHFGLSCKYDHRCAVKKCGKFGHGAHICRLRLRDQASSSGSSHVTQETASHASSSKTRN